MYRLVDCHGYRLDGTFYEPELQKVIVSADKPYRVEAELRRRNNGREVLVKWFGYPESFSIWIDARTLTAYTRFPNKIREWRCALLLLLIVSLYYTARDPYPDTSVIMIVVVLGAFACLIRLRKNLLVRRQIAECIDDVFVQHRGRRVRS